MEKNTINNNQGNRDNEGKLKWSYLPQFILEDVVRVLEYGAKKYEKYNWMKGFPVSELYESEKRHMDKFMEGEYYDSESKLPHLAHAIANLIFLIWTMKYRKDLDDRILTLNFDIKK